MDIKTFLGAQEHGDGDWTFELPTQVHGAFGGAFGGLIAACTVLASRSCAPGRTPVALDCRFLRALPAEEYRAGNHVELGFSSFTGLLVAAGAARAEDPPRADFFIWADDVEYTIRLRRHGRIVLVPEAVIVHKTRMGGRGNTLRGRIVNRLMGVEYPSADWDSYWKNLHMFRNFAWIKREHFGAGRGELGLVAGAYVVKSLLYDAKPLQRVPWILWASARGRCGEPLGMSPERWERVVREGLRPPAA